MKKLAFIRLTKEMREDLEKYLKSSYSLCLRAPQGRRHPSQLKELLKERVFIYFGEIPNMPGHCVVAGHESGKIFSGYHTDDFEQIPDEET